MCLWVSNKEKMIFFRIFKVAEERGRIRIHLPEGTNPRIRILIRIRTKMSRTPTLLQIPPQRQVWREQMISWLLSQQRESSTLIKVKPRTRSLVWTLDKIRKLSICTVKHYFNANNRVPVPFFFHYCWYFYRWIMGSVVFLCTMQNLS